MEIQAAISSSKYGFVTSTSRSNFLFNYFYRISLTFVCFSLTSTLHAQEKTPIKAEVPAQQVEVRGDASKYDPRRDDTVTKFVINKEEIEKYGDISIVDTLNRQPGIVNGNLNGLRGYTQYLIDGQQPPRNFRLEDIQISQVERIEIIRSAVAEFSTQAIGGTVNIVLKRDVKASSRKLQLSFIHQDESKLGKRLSFNFAEKLDDISFDIAAIVAQTYFGRNTWTSFESTDALLEKRLDQVSIATTENRNLAYVFNPTLNWKISEEESIQIKTRIARVYGKTRDRYLKTLFNSSTPTPQIEDSQSNWEPRIGYLEGSWSKRLSEQIKLNNNFIVSQVAADAKSHTRITTLGSIQKEDSKVIEHSRSFIWKGDVSYDPNDKQSFKSGWNIESNDSRLLESDGLTSELPAKVHIQKLALFSQKEWNADDIWSHYLGLRWEGFRTNVSATDGARLQKTTSVLSPIAQTRWKNPANKENQIRFALARTFKNPETSQMIATAPTHLNNDLTLPDTIGNPNLRPEIAWGLDSAFEHFGETEFNYSISHYVKKIDYLMRDRVFQEQGRWLQQIINDGNAIAHGVTLETSFPLPLLFQAAPSVNIKANLSRHWSHVKNIPGPDNRFAEQAKLNANLSGDYRLNDTWKMGASYGLVSGGPLRVAPDRINLVQVKHSISAYTNWTLNKEVNIRFSASKQLLQPLDSQTTFLGQKESITTRTHSRAVLFFNVKFELKF